MIYTDGFVSTNDETLGVRRSLLKYIDTNLHNYKADNPALTI